MLLVTLPSVVKLPKQALMALMGADSVQWHCTGEAGLGLRKSISWRVETSPGETWTLE
jgi:hypothetical protein